MVHSRLVIAHLVLAASTLVACSSASPAADGAGDLPRDVAALDTAHDAGPVSDLARDQGADAAPCTLLKPYSSKDAVCNQCAQAKCCAEINGCLGDPECDDAYVNCILACTLPPEPDAGLNGCLQQCATDHPQGQAAYDVAIGCAETRCAVECS